VFFEFWVVFSRGEVEEGGLFVYFKELLRVIVIWVLWVGIRYPSRNCGRSR
jgi:hypothetical protein